MKPNQKFNATMLFSKEHRLIYEEIKAEGPAETRETDISKLSLTVQHIINSITLLDGNKKIISSEEHDIIQILCGEGFDTPENRKKQVNLLKLPDVAHKYPLSIVKICELLGKTFGKDTESAKLLENYAKERQSILDKSKHDREEMKKREKLATSILEKKEYTVVTGDSLWKIAQKMKDGKIEGTDYKNYKYSIVGIINDIIDFHNSLALNGKSISPISTKTILLPGQKIYLPAKYEWRIKARAIAQYSDTERVDLSVDKEIEEKASLEAAQREADKIDSSIQDAAEGKMSETGQKESEEKIKSSLHEGRQKMKEASESNLLSAELFNAMQKAAQMESDDIRNISSEYTSWFTKLTGIKFETGTRGGLASLPSNGESNDSAAKKLKEYGIVYHTQGNVTDQVMGQIDPETRKEPGFFEKAGGFLIESIKGNAITIPTALIISQATGNIPTIVYVFLLGRFHLGLTDAELKSKSEKKLQPLGQFLYYSFKIETLNKQIDEENAKDSKDQKKIDKLIQDREIFLTKFQLFINALEKERNDGLIKALESKFSKDKDKDTLTLKEGEADKTKLDEFDAEIIRNLRQAEAEKYLELKKAYTEKKDSASKTALEQFISEKYNSAVDESKQIIDISPDKTDETKPLSEDQFKEEIIRQKDIRAKVTSKLKEYESAEDDRTKYSIAQKIRKLQTELRSIAYRDKRSITTHQEQSVQAVKKAKEHHTETAVEISEETARIEQDKERTPEEQARIQSYIQEIDKGLEERKKTREDLQKAKTEREASKKTIDEQYSKASRWWLSNLLKKDHNVEVADLDKKITEAQGEIGSLDLKYQSKELELRFGSGLIDASEMKRDEYKDYISDLKYEGVGDYKGKFEPTDHSMQTILTLMLGRYEEKIIGKGKIGETMRDLNSAFKDWKSPDKPHMSGIMRGPERIGLLEGEGPLQTENASYQKYQAYKKIPEILKTKLFPKFREIGIENVPKDFDKFEKATEEQKKEIKKILFELYEAVVAYETFDIKLEQEQETEKKKSYEALKAQMQSLERGAKTGQETEHELNFQTALRAYLVAFHDGKVPEEALEDVSSVGSYHDRAEFLEKDAEIDLKNLEQDARVSPKANDLFSSIQKKGSKMENLSREASLALLTQLDEDKKADKPYDRAKFDKEHLSAVRTLFEEIHTLSAELNAQLALAPDKVEQLRNAEIIYKSDRVLIDNKIFFEKDDKSLQITESGMQFGNILAKVENNGYSNIESIKNDLKAIKGIEPIKLTESILAFTNAKCKNFPFPIPLNLIKDPDPLTSASKAAAFYGLAVKLNKILSDPKKEVSGEEGLNIWKAFHDMLKTNYGIDLYVHTSLATTSPYEMLKTDDATKAKLEQYGLDPRLINLLMLQLPRRKDKTDGVDKPPIGRTIASTVALLGLKLTQQEIITSLAQANYLTREEAFIKYGKSINTGVDYFGNSHNNDEFTLDGGYDVEFKREVIVPDKKNPNKFFKKTLTCTILLRQKCFNVNIAEEGVFKTAFKIIETPEGIPAAAPAPIQRYLDFTRIGEEGRKLLLPLYIQQIPTPEKEYPKIDIDIDDIPIPRPPGKPGAGQPGGTDAGFRTVQ